MAIYIGWTGTRAGLTKDQIYQLGNMICDFALHPDSDHYGAWGLHGDCIGGDADFDAVCKSHNVKTRCRPCLIENQRAFVAVPLAEPERPLDRNKKIVDDSSVMIAGPKSSFEERRGGTWSTIRYARKQNKRLFIIYPDGFVREE